MLCLQLRKSESVTIDVNGEKIKVVFMGWHGSRAVIGFKAPRSISIMRDEVLERDNYQEPSQPRR